METRRKQTSRADLTPKIRRGTKIQDRDIKYFFLPMRTHGPLTSKYLCAYAEEEYPSVYGCRNRLSKLSRHGQYRLDRPAQRISRYKPRPEEPELYANSKEIDELLCNAKLTSKKHSIALNHINLRHEKFLSHCTASIELGALAEGVPFLNEDGLLPRAPSKSRIMPCKISYNADVWDERHNAWRKQLQTSEKELHPDAYFALMRNEKATVFFLEADCGGEQKGATNLDKKSWLATLLKYMHVIDTGYYKKHFGLEKSGALVLLVFNKRSAMESVMEKLSELANAKGKSYFLFKTWTDFDNDFFLPKEVNYSLFNDPWQRVGYDPLYI